MGEAKRRREAGFTGEKRKPEKGLRGRKALRASAVVTEIPKPGQRMVVDGQQYFHDPVTGSLRKVGPKLQKVIKKRLEKIEEKKNLMAEKSAREFLRRKELRDAIS